MDRVSRSSFLCVIAILPTLLVDKQGFAAPLSNLNGPCLNSASFPKPSPPLWHGLDPQVARQRGSSESRDAARLPCPHTSLVLPFSPPHPKPRHFNPSSQSSSVRFHNTCSKLLNDTYSLYEPTPPSWMRLQRSTMLSCWALVSGS